MLYHDIDDDCKCGKAARVVVITSILRGILVVLLCDDQVQYSFTITIIIFTITLIVNLFNVHSEVVVNSQCSSQTI